MIKIDGKRVVFSECAVLKADARSVSFSTPIGLLTVQFGGNDSPKTDVRPEVVDGGATFYVSDADTFQPFSYDGTFNENGAPAYDISFYVSPLGGERRARFVALTVVGLQP